MGATSVTGVGLGDSGGRYKPANSACSSCSGRCADETESTPTTVVKRGCYVRHKAGGGASISVGQSHKIKVCS